MRGPERCEGKIKLQEWDGRMAGRGMDGWMVGKGRKEKPDKPRGDYSAFLGGGRQR